MRVELSPREEVQFREQLEKVFLSKLRWGFLAAALLFAAFTWLDLTLDPHSLERNWLVRGSAVTGYLALYLTARWRGARRFVTALFLAGIVIGAASLTWISLGMPEAGQTLAVGSLMLVIALTAAVGPAFRVAVFAYATQIGVSNAVAVTHSAPASFLIAVNAFVFAGAITGALMALVTDRLSRRAFKLQLELEVMATRDPLTGARNRGSFMTLAAEELRRTDRYGGPLSLLLLDIDRFKSINDSHGHPAGDAVIRALVDASLLQLRTVDVLGRVGGEEFAVLLPQTALPAAVAMAERLREALAAVRVPHGEHPLSFTVSIGAAERSAGEPLDRMIFRADEALYAAKHGGRNQVRPAA